MYQTKVTPKTKTATLRVAVIFLILFGSPARTRTTDKVVNSHLLYQLSYRGMVSDRNNVLHCRLR